mmetsp:Transcript_2621/g.8080  ORF Transcript_2621/g.8080 Transcript_2621/m.8080 type:complete len:708 (+) Transcript_2621:68-2191(+)
MVVACAHHGHELPSFENLIKSLCSAHEQQQDIIKRLGEENSFLRERLNEALTSLRNVAVQSNDVPPPEHQEAAPIELQVPEEESCQGHLRSQSLSSQPLSSQRSSNIGWPVPDLWPQWAERQGRSSMRIASRKTWSALFVVEDSTGQTLTTVNRFYQKLIVRPNSPCRLAWDFSSSIMVCYDVVTIPIMAISLSPTDFLGGGTGGFTDIMDFVTTTFWTLDMPWSFLTGFHSEGVVEMRAGEIAKHYLWTWFAFDFFIICIDWAIVYASSLGTTASAFGLFRIGKTARVARILRAIRLLRFVKLQRILAETLELINSESIRAFFNVSLAVAFIFTINHYLACGWFLAGHVGWAMGVPNWITSNEVDVKNSSVYAYFTSLHWSLTQFTPASMEIRPFNTGERVYSIACLMFALITFSSFLGSITASITQLRKHTTEIGKQQLALRSYLSKNKVSGSLSKAVWRFLRQHHFNHQTRSHAEQVALLKLLPPHLKDALNQELYGPYVTRAPFFYHYMAICSEGLAEVCSSAVTERSLICSEALFYEGKTAEMMFFTASGFLKYEHVQVRFNQTVSTGSWLAEPVLWVKWVHVATLTADTTAELIGLDSAKFRRVVAEFKNCYPFVRAYARIFQEYLQQQGSQYLTDLLTDIDTLEALTREAWFEVTTSKEQDQFSEMPQREFPKTPRRSRQRQIEGLFWRTAKRRSFWPGS